MPQLLDLPPELLSHIILNLEIQDERSTLASLCQVSRIFCQLAQPVLFKEFNTPQRVTASFVAYEENWDLEPLDPLLSFTITVISRPDLAARVRSIIVETSDTGLSATDEYYEMEAPSEDVIKAFVKAVHRVNAKSKTAWLSALIGLEVDALTSLLISHTPNLERLRLHVDDERPGKQLRELVKNIIYCPTGVPSPPYLQNLKVLRLGYFLSYGGFNNSQVTELLSLPTLEEFWARNCIGNNDRESYPKFFAEPGQFSFSRIIISQSCMDVEALTMLVQACKCLQTFQYTGRYFEELTLEDDVFAMASLHEILHSQRDSLEKIDINLSEFTGRCPWYEFDLDDIFDSLAMYPNLRFLSMEQCYLAVGVELPSLLETLVICECSAPVYDMVADMAMRSKSEFRYLTRLHLTYATNGMGILTFEKALELTYPCLDKEKAKEPVKRLETLFSGTSILLDCDWGAIRIGIRQRAAGFHRRIKKVM
jgi:hypothetical protein